MPTKVLLSTVIALSLFFGGIALLLSHLAFWSYFFGIPAVQIGIVLLILTFERLSKKTLNEEIEEEMLRLKQKEEEGK